MPKVLHVPNDTSRSNVCKYLSSFCGVNDGVRKLSSSLLAEQGESTTIQKPSTTRAASELSLLLPNVIVELCSNPLLILISLASPEKQEAGNFETLKGLDKVSFINCNYM